MLNCYLLTLSPVGYGRLDSVVKKHIPKGMLPEINFFF